MARTNDSALKVLNVLINEKDFVSSTSLINRIGCDRKTIYKSIATLEINGFGIEIKDQKNPYKPTMYKLNGIYGF